MNRVKNSIKAKTVEMFNRNNPVGTPVRYWTGAIEGEGKTGKTRSEAQLLGGHTPVVWVDTHAACVALTHVMVIREVKA